MSSSSKSLEDMGIPTKTKPFFSVLSCLAIISICWGSILRSPAVAMAQPQNSTTIPVDVGVVLDLEAWVGKLGLRCIQMALSDFYAIHSHYKTRLILQTRDSKKDVVGAAAAALDLIKNVQVQAIIGPETSMQSNFVINLGNKSQVPIISFSATSPSLSSIRSPYFFRATQNDSSQVKAISAIVQAFGWREVVPIVMDNEFGEGVIPYLTDALEEIDARVPYRSVIHETATDDEIAAELYKLMTMQTRVFVMHMYPSLGSRVFAKAEEIGMMNKGYVWIMTDGMTNHWSAINRSAMDSMQGALAIRSYVPRSKMLEDLRAQWKRNRNFQEDNLNIVDAELDIFGLLAYDATFALAMAVEEAGITKLRFDKTTSNVSRSATDLVNFGVSRNGPRLIQALSSTRFRGLTGDFHFVNGQLQSSVFQIINVNGNGERGIGFWTPENGLTKNLNSKNESRTYSTSKANLAPIIWPGDSNSDPKGWEIPTNRKKLKIGVPVKKGFSEFVSVKRDPSTNDTEIKGYSIDIFQAAIDAMLYAVSYELVPFETPEGEMAGTYDDLIYQVYTGNYDAAVGDTTIVANRSQYVDFTLPYTESGVSMVVPIRDNREKNAWVFLKPLTRDLWVTSACFFVFIGFVVWILEHRINEDFRGPPSHQIGTSFWFSFSTMVFAHRERVVSNLARFVVILWCFVVLILTQSYTASLTSLLTVQQLQPTVTDVRELLRKGLNVGFQNGSFVEGILKGLTFEPSKLKKFNSSEELHELFTKGSANGGIAAAFDEIPYMKLFLAKYCSKYSMVEPTFKTDGFGFAFPRGSPLVPDISRAILNVTEGDKMEEIESTWFKKTTGCPDPSSIVSSSSLSLQSFWGLFLIVGVASVSALIIYGATFLYEQRNLLFRSDSKTSLWQRICIVSGIFDQKDLNSHTFRRGEFQNRSGIDSVHEIGGVEMSPSAYCPPSPSSSSNQTDSSFVFLGEQARHSTEHGDLSVATSPEGRNGELAPHHVDTNGP